MPMHYKIRLIAGTFLLISLALAQWASPWWLLFSAFIGVNLIQSSFTRWCLMEDILRATGLHRDSASEALRKSEAAADRSRVGPRREVGC